ncbi:MAG: hypothetical protein IJ122_00350 [Methanobrevibacter sp.]|nr:hypothetical protein [Methanobrevibacter sp.]
MEAKSNIDKNMLKEKNSFDRKDLLKVILLLKIASINNKLKRQKKYRKTHEKIIEICNRYPHNEKMLFYKIQSLRNLNKSYKSLECIEDLLKINPHNRPALFIIANIYEGE